MTATSIHLATPTPRALCGVLPVYWTNDAQAVTCPACTDAMDLQPS